MAQECGYGIPGRTRKRMAGQASTTPFIICYDGLCYIYNMFIPLKTFCTYTYISIYIRIIYNVKSDKIKMTTNTKFRKPRKSDCGVASVSAPDGPRYTSHFTLHRQSYKAIRRASPPSLYNHTFNHERELFVTRAKLISRSRVSSRVLHHTGRVYC